MINSKLRSIIIVLALSLAPPLSGSILAQEVPATKNATAKKLIPETLVEKLEKDAQKFKGTMDDITKLISKDISKIKNAEAVFDKMIKMVRAAADTYGPRSDYVRNIDQLVEQARTDADNARNEGYNDFAVGFEQDAEDIKIFKDKAIAIYRDTERNIAAIEKKKKYFVFLIKRQYYSRAKDTLKKGESLMSEYNNKLNDTANSAPDANSPEVAQ